MHIVIVNRWPRFDDGVRWDNELTRYEQFVDHTAHRVSYVVDREGAAGVLAPPGQIACTVEIEDVNDVDALRAAVREVMDRVGPVDQLIALSEFTLEVAARVREDLAIPGPLPDEVAVYRNKLRMKEVVGGAGIPVPRFAPCTDLEACRALARDAGFPLVLKPVDGAASIGVHRVSDRPQLERLLAAVDAQRHQVEEFVSGDILHVDGFVDETATVAFQIVSRYVNDCLAFQQGQPLGSVVVRSEPLRRRIEAFTERCVSALGIARTPFHLELFHTPADELVFLEIGARVGGSEVPHLLNEVYGVNLYELWLGALTGCHRDVPAPPQDAPAGGWLVIPKPEDRPVRVRRAGSVRAHIRSVSRELVPAVGTVLEPGGSYDALHSGRFILVGDSEAEVESDIRRIIAEYDFDAVPL